MTTIRDNRSDDLSPGDAVYGTNGKFLGQFVEKLSDILVPAEQLQAMVNGAPHGRILPPSSSHDIVPTNVYGVRRVWCREFGSQEQFLVRSIDQSPAWMNVRDSEKLSPLPEAPAPRTRTRSSGPSM